MITDDQESAMNDAFTFFIETLKYITYMNKNSSPEDVMLLALEKFYSAVLSTIKDKKLAIEISRQMHEDTLARVLTDGLGDATRH